jgi:cytochrome c-type protein NapC
VSEPTENEKPERRWSKLWRPPYKWYLLWLPTGGILMFVVGIIFWGGFNTVLEATNTESFCISCHEMREYLYPEYQKTVHFKNRTGVRAVCSDCHVPKPWFYKMARKINATFIEIPGKIMGNIDTREKFEAKRLELAERVWATMQSTDSRECRNCHALVSMDLELQDKSAQKRHTLESVRESGKTCIDCHKGIAHELPEGYE